jgi:L-ascorbate metabolism protein UlaG (beta-lactamase superfamily)
MRASPLWQGGAFRNTAPVGPTLQRGQALPVMGEFVFGRKNRTPPGPLPSQDPRPSWARPAETGLRATWLGHSTVLVEIDGFAVLTDPVWGDRASPWSFAGPRRFQPVPVALEALPDLDAVIVSHDHYDHLDHPTILALAAREVPFVTSLGVGAHLQAWGVPPERIIELDWWEKASLWGGELVITAAPAQHFSGRALGDRNGTLWSSFAMETHLHRAFFSGDTGLTREYGEIRARLGPFQLVMLEVGAYHPAWGTVHLGPENALEALHLLGGGKLLPVHWGTFNLGIHAWDDPAERLLALAPALRAELVMPRLGQPVEPARVERVDPWWRALSRPAAARAQDALAHTPVPGR